MNEQYSQKDLSIFLKTAIFVVGKVKFKKKYCFENSLESPVEPDHSLFSADKFYRYAQESASSQNAWSGYHQLLWRYNFTSGHGTWWLDAARRVYVANG